MVRSRSETNLNRIFVDLCTSPEIRTKLSHQRNHQRQYHPPLPTLQPIKSNSCSNINQLEENLNQSSSSSSFTNDQTEQRDTLNDLTYLQPPESTAVPLVPMESTGFTVQPTTFSINHSLKLFETLSVKHWKKSSSHDQTPKDNKKTNTLPLTSNPSNLSQDWKQQDFTNRLQNRLKSRGHLRKFFLS
jgi:hypothetical protein